MTSAAPITNRPIRKSKNKSKNNAPPPLEPELPAATVPIATKATGTKMRNAKATAASPRIAEEFFFPARGKGGASEV